MSSFSESSGAARICAASAVALLISFGLCGLGSGLAYRGSAIGGLATIVGFGLFMGSIVGLVLGIFTAIVAALRR